MAARSGGSSALTSPAAASAMTGRAEYIGTSHRSNRVVRVPVLVEIASLRREIESTFALTLSLGHLANDAESHLSASKGY